MRLALGAQEPSDGLDLAVGHKRTVQARYPPATGHVEHVALAQQLLCTLFAENGAGVDLAGNLEANPGREIGLDRAGDHIN